MNKMTKSVYFALIRYFVENAVIQWADETNIMKNSFQKLALKKDYTGFNLYVGKFVRIMFEEMEKDSSQILYFRDYLES